MTRKRMWLVVSVFPLSACSEPAPAERDTGDPHGPPGGIIEIDPTTIPLGESGTGGTSGTAGGSTGGAGTGSGATGGTGGTSGTSGGSAGSGATGGGPVTGTVGRPCESDADCDSSTYCRSDAVDYIGHKQCTMGCSASATCEAAFGASSFCIGAMICVAACISDADCFPRTHCNVAGWCERGGPGSGIPYCGGSATPCSLLSTLDCISANGCTSDSECTGSARSCLSQTDQFRCAGQQGCVWISNTCSGSARSCSLFSGSATCTSQDGCTWDESCTGIADSCSVQPVPLCANQPGCVVLQ